MNEEELPEEIKELTKVQADSMGVRVVNKGYEHCINYQKPDKCTLGKQLACSKFTGCRKIQVNKLFLNYFLLRCRNHHFGMLYVITAHKLVDDPFMTLANNCHHEGCTLKWKIKERKGIRKHSELVKYLYHLVEQWKTPKHIIQEIYYTYMFYQTGLFPILKDRGFGNVSMTQFMAAKKTVINKLVTDYLMRIMYISMRTPLEEWLEQIKS